MVPLWLTTNKEQSKASEYTRGLPENSAELPHSCRVLRRRTSCGRRGPVWRRGQAGATGEDLHRRQGSFPGHSFKKSRLWPVACTFDLHCSFFFFS